MDSLLSLSTWRHLGRVAFHCDPDQRSLPPKDNPAAVRAWSEGYRIAWRAYYAQLPATDLDEALLEYALTQVLDGQHQRESQANRIDVTERPRHRLH